MTLRQLKTGAPAAKAPTDMSLTDINFKASGGRTGHRTIQAESIAPSRRRAGYQNNDGPAPINFKGQLGHHGKVAHISYIPPHESIGFKGADYPVAYGDTTPKMEHHPSPSVRSHRGPEPIPPKDAQPFRHPTPKIDPFFSGGEPAPAEYIPETGKSYPKLMYLYNPYAKAKTMMAKWTKRRLRRQPPYDGRNHPDPELRSSPRDGAWVSLHHKKNKVKAMVHGLYHKEKYPKQIR